MILSLPELAFYVIALIAAAGVGYFARMTIEINQREREQERHEERRATIARQLEKARRRYVPDPDEPL